MKNIKYAIDLICKRPFIFLMLIIEIVLTTIIMLQNTSNLLKCTDTYKMSKEMYPVNGLYRILATLPNATDNYSNMDINSTDYKKKLLSLYEYMNSNQSFDFFTAKSSNIIIKDFTDKDIFYYDSNKYIINPYKNIDGQYSNIKAIYIDKKYSDNFHLNVKTGSNFSDCDFNSSNGVPVILGAQYKKIYNIGDTFHIFDWFTKKEKEITVLGFLNENSYMYNNGSILSLDDYIIYPMEQITDVNTDNDLYMFYLQDSLIHTDLNAESIGLIRKKSNELNLYDYSIYSADKDITNLLTNLKLLAISSTLKMSLSIVFICASIVIVQLNQIKETIKEYGIHLMLGANKRDIILRNIYSTLIYFTIGLGIGLYFEYYRKKNDSMYYYDFRMPIIITCIYFVLLLLISLLLYRKISKLNINQIMKDVNDN